MTAMNPRDHEENSNIMHNGQVHTCSFSASIASVSKRLFSRRDIAIAAAIAEPLDEDERAANDDDDDDDANDDNDDDVTGADTTSPKRCCHVASSKPRKAASTSRTLPLRTSTQ